MHPLLLADIGGTNARFAFHDGRQGPVTSLALADFPGPEALLAAALAGRQVRGMVLAVAGPVQGNAVVMSGPGWRLDGAALGATIINDFEALAWALPALGPADLLLLGGDPPITEAPLAVLGPGTGLGVAAWLPPGRVLASEGGHASIAAGDDREAAILALLRAQFGTVSAEMLLSGRGLVAIHQALATLEGRPVETPTPAEAALVPATMAVFCGFLGGFAGDVALMFGARGGVYLGGGILPRHAAALASSAFRRCFEAKGAFHSYVAPIPTWLITRDHPALLGAARYAEAHGL